MGKVSKSSRKGKKAWRANISTEDIDDFYEKSTKDALSGGSLTAVPSESLFFVDKSSDLSVKKKIEKNRDRVLRFESILQKNQFVEPMPSSKKKSKKIHRNAPKAIEVSQDVQKDDNVPSSGMADLWDVQGYNDIKEKKAQKSSIIPAVEVEPAGCSYNPSFESHQDSLARAVADEMQKVYRNELGPEPVPLTVLSNSIEDEEASHKAVLDFINKEIDIDEENTEDLDVNEEDTPLDARASKRKRVTRVEQNKRAKRKEVLKGEAEAKKVKDFSKQIDNLEDIIQEITEEDVDKQSRHLRRAVVKQERAKVAPPRMGKHKFQPAPLQVLLSEDITGSLRKLKGCCTLARDRFKSLEKRGLLAPTAKSSRK